ncbi:MAG: phosphoenolpyruvate carboxykinase, partial [Clostridium sp.]
MRKEFSMSNDKILINFSAKYCNNFQRLTESEGFRRVVEVYLKKSQNKLSLSYKYLSESLNTNDIGELRKEVIRVIKYLTVMDVNEVLTFDENYKTLFCDKDSFIYFVED